MDKNVNTSKLIELLDVLLATNYTLQLKTQNFHWNVTGPNFGSLHSLFETQYNDLAQASDNIAERMRAINSKVEASFSHFMQITKIKEGSQLSKWTEMVEQLYKDHQLMSDLCKNAIIEAESLHDEATCNILEERMERHEKFSWMLRSTLE